MYNQSSYFALDETSSYWSAPKTPNFSAFHWSPYGSLVFRNHGGSTFTEKD